MKTQSWFTDRIGMKIQVDNKPFTLVNENQALWMYKAQSHGYTFGDVVVRTANVCIACEG